MFIRIFEFAEYAAMTDESKFVIGGIFDSVNATRPPTIPAGAPDVLVMPNVWLVWVAEASLADGLTHTMGLRILNDDGIEVWAQPTMGSMNFILNDTGRPMRFNGRMQLAGLALPGTGDYTFELYVDGSKRADTRLYVQIHASRWAAGRSFSHVWLRIASHARIAKSRGSEYSRIFTSRSPLLTAAIVSFGVSSTTRRHPAENGL